ncbi:MAG: SUMF1/EgtB/PvdO family nonheme iron enzyme [Thiotrichales bacterium]|jgi:formylglycine-generating enzyme required for sulfatase activity|nr:SUMF1/EgtB/PvdO family nonheme iron enzyme [Thiotrichales bacterium]MBT3612920.1 SUMF1/EgtB/PvdO family nonheme iron enzyme [Thiotrichales bacterium]MBT3752407.1 SUMF1/EgtB/PvdO family nonheme iron enzyme [Thiotrichales bacterium]MBT3836909.1 SUMF1/EgtB/PvdO family nonheme iron enzyme [Thiotrichales bacterium]MBT4152480.1 SUMF1/EgtB/PvdO family nonheme iron enzyme [Thiotrichales bacterium]
MKTILLLSLILLISSSVVRVSAAEYVQDSSEQDINMRDLRTLVDSQMVEIIAGEFMMGDAVGRGVEDELPLHRVSIPKFKIGRTELTFEIYELYLDDTGEKSPEDEGWGRGQYPVINISWNRAAEFISWLNQKLKPQHKYRLPTEAEWEYSARAGTAGDYWWKGGFDPSKWTFTSTQRVASMEPNQFGLYDTAGNVAEWVADRFKDYDRTPRDGSMQQGGIFRVVRGGGWDQSELGLRVSNRESFHPGYGYYSLGFRLAQDM